MKASANNYGAVSAAEVCCFSVDLARSEYDCAPPVVPLDLPIFVAPPTKTVDVDTGYGAAEQVLVDIFTDLEGETHEGEHLLRVWARKCD